MLSSSCDTHVPAYMKVADELVSNDEQWTGYESQGHFVVLAGPGSGKTKVLTTKLARILHEDVEVPRGVACVTYSNECARELKRRLAKLGIRPDRRTFVGTVHSFCFQHVIIPFAHLSGLNIANPIRVVTTSEQSKCFADALVRIAQIDVFSYQADGNRTVLRGGHDFHNFRPTIQTLGFRSKLQHLHDLLIKLLLIKNQGNFVNIGDVLCGNDVFRTNIAK